MRIGLIATVATLIATAAAAQSAASCRTSPNLVGACFSVHGRLFIHNGSPPTVRIIEAGTNRVFAIFDRQFQSKGDEVAPTVVTILLHDDPLAEIEGLYVVCPFEREAPRSLRPVCIEASSHLAARRK